MSDADDRRVAIRAMRRKILTAIRDTFDRESEWVSAVSYQSDHLVKNMTDAAILVWESAARHEAWLEENPYRHGAINRNTGRIGSADER